MRCASFGRVLVVMLALSSFAHRAAAQSAPVADAAAPVSESGCDGTVASPVDLIVRQAENAWGAGDRDAARAAIENVATGPGRTLPYALLRVANVAQEIGDAPRAEALRRQALVAAQAESAAARVTPDPGQVYSIAARLRLAPADAAAARADLATLRATPGADARFACHLVWVALSLADAGDVPAASALLADLRRAVPTARSIADASVSMAFRTNDPARIEAALHEALAAFPGDVEFTVRLANRMKLAGHRDEARALLEGMLMRGEASPSLLGELLGLVSGAVSAEQLQHWTNLATEHPDLPALQMIVGVEHHYLHHFAESNTYLLRTGELMNHEPRIAMYIAMNYFRLGQQALAEQYIERARAADRPDPDIDYCRAVIRVRQDPSGSIADLRRYLAYTSRRPDVDPGKQARVQQTLTLLEGCVNGPDPHGCVEREVVEQARALAFREHYPGTNPGAADAGATHASDTHAPSSRPSPGGGVPRAVIAAVVAVIVALGIGIVVARRRR